MIVVTRNHLWLVNFHHKGHSNADVTSLTNIITWLQEYSWYHLWDHFSGWILDTSATANVWFYSDFISLTEFSYTYLHQDSKHQQQIHVKTRTGPHQSADIHIGVYFPLFLSFLLPTLSSWFFFYHVFYSFFSCYFFTWYFFSTTLLPFVLLPFFLLLFSGAKMLLFFLFLYLHPDCYFFACYSFSCYFFPTQNCYFFPVTFVPVTFFPSTEITVLTMLEAFAIRSSHRANHSNAMISRG